MQEGRAVLLTYRVLSSIVDIGERVRVGPKCNRSFS
jgi:hypothetical protein